MGGRGSTGGGAAGLKAGGKFTGHHAVWGNVTGTVTSVHKNGSIVGNITTASGHTVNGVAFSAGEARPAR